MSDFFYLIPISILLGAAGLAIFLWTLRDGQYDDLDGASQRILYDEDEPRREPARNDSSAPPPPDEPLP